MQVVLENQTKPAANFSLFASSFLLRLNQKMTTWGRPLLRRNPLHWPTSSSFSSSPPFPSNLNNPAYPLTFNRTFASMSEQESTSPHSNSVQSQIPRTITSRWKPMCLYYTQGRCTMMDDALHIDKFSHNCAVENAFGLINHLQPQQFDYFLVLDLEGKVEILEFPVLLFDAKTLEVVDLFHRFVRPTRMTEQRIDQYIEGKYGKFGVDRVWHETAIKFADVIEQFESWLSEHKLWKNGDGHLHRAAFVTCGNWDVKTKIPQQCEVAGMVLPQYFTEWINLKDIYLNFYNQTASGMRSMLNQRGIQALGSHHLGMDDSKNIARVLQRLLTDGAVLQITARRTSSNHVKFLFQNRI